MGQLTYLIDEICCGLEIYYSGRIGGQYFKTAFILCDDYTELTSKLFLLTDNPQWSDTHPTTSTKPATTTKPKARFKNYYDIQNDVQTVIGSKHSNILTSVKALHDNMKARRTRRNNFFHSTHLLDLNVNLRAVVESYCDLLDYGMLLFKTDWQQEIAARPNLDTLQIMLQLEKKNFNDPSVLPKINTILANWPCNKPPNHPKKGVYITIHPEDLHLRLCVRDGGIELRNKLVALL